MPKKKVFVSGHKNPDTDSICSAIAYAELKNRLNQYEAIPIRLGNLNQETKFVLDYFKMDAPDFMESMKPQVKDLDWDRAYSISKEVSIYQAMNLLQDHSLSCLPIVNADQELIGVVSISDIMGSYMEIWDDYILSRSETTIDNIIDVLSAKILHEPKESKPLTGRMSIVAMDPKQTDGLVNEGDIIIVGNRQDAQEEAIKSKAAVVILTGGYELKESLKELAIKKNVTVLSTHFNSFMAARLLPQAVPVSHVMTKENLVTFRSDQTIDEVQEMMTQSRFRAYPVLDYQNKVIGTISRYHLISNEKKKLILVDHNEKNQAIDDIEEAEILEIIDHHRVANIFTEGPIYFRNEPVGSTATIVSSMYFENGILPSREIAGILCAAIISDTLLFRSPTSTSRDERILERMAKIAHIDPEKFAMEMFKEGTSLENKKAIDLLRNDVKQFVIEGKAVRVAQVFTVDIESLIPIKEDLLVQMENLRVENDETTFVLMITDIFQELSEVLVVGSYGEELARAFKKDLVDHGFTSAGLLSRKKQMIPVISKIIETNH